MSLPAPVTSRLSLPLGNLLAAAVAALLAAALPAQARPARFELPEPPFRYDDARADLLGGGVVGCVASGPDADQAAAAARRVKQARLRDHRAALGRVLFYDPMLSRNGRRSCSSCHEQARGFTDGRARSKGFRGKRTHRNSMSIVNLAYRQGPLFWDGRAATLEQMVLMPIEDEIEMGLEVDELLRRLRRDEHYVELFDRAFESRYISRERLATALATFLRAVVSHGSRYDEGLAAVHGAVDKPFPNFSAIENHGKQLFFGIGGDRAHSCAACHVGRAPSNCGATVSFQPELFSHQGLRNNGLSDRGDRGHAAVSGLDQHTRQFRAPSLRNVAVTGPYMHDGRFRTLEDVVSFYAHGVKRDRYLDAAMQPKAGGGWGGPRGVARTVSRTPSTPMLSSQAGFAMGSRDRRALVAFLKTLTDDKLLRDPRFSDPFVASRRAWRSRP